jgi:hypothetical protein
MGKADPTKEPPRRQDESRDVLADPALSKDQKDEVLDGLEQDALQLSVATNEGMPGGAPSQLHDILGAKALLDLPPTAHAYAVVAQDLRARLTAGVTDEVRGVVEQALTALGAVARLPAPDRPSAGAGPAQVGRRAPGSAGEIADEIAREKLDP